MSATPIQHALDLARSIEYQTEDAAASAAAADAVKALDEHGIDLWCGEHLGTHRLGLDDVERLIYGLVGDRADSYTGEVRLGYEDQPGWKIAGEWCPLDDLGWMQDGETYAEFIDGCVESRQLHESADDPANR